MKKDLLFAYIALGVVCIIWGTTYLALRIAVENFPPLLFTGLRQTLSGFIIIVATLIYNKGGWPSMTHVLRQAIAGFFMISVGNGFVAWGEMYIPSGIAAILCSLMPGVVILINLGIERDERPNAKILIGVALGLLGIILIFSEHLAEFSRPEYIGGILLTFGAVLGWALGSIWIKKKNNSTNLFLNAGLQMLGGGLLLFPISIVFDDYSTISFGPEAVYPFIYLVVFGSIIAYLSFSYALRKLPMTIVSLYAYINPLVAIILGWAVLNEKLNLKILVAFAITIAGIYLVNRGYQQVKAWQNALSSR